MNHDKHQVLLVEDDANDILFVQRAFSRVSGKTLIQVLKDGDAAVDYLAGLGAYGNRDRYPIPSLILLDLKLPRRSGTEVLAWIRQQPGIRRIPVVVLTSSQESIDLERAYDLGVNSYLVKPVRFEDLAKMIEAIELYWLGLNEYPPFVPSA